MPRLPPGSHSKRADLDAHLVVFETYFGWEDRRESFNTWLWRAAHLRGKQAPGAGAVEAVALAGAFLTGSCVGLDLIGTLANERRTSDKLEPKYDALLKRIATAVSDLLKVEPVKRAKACDLVDREVVVDLASLR